MHAGKGTLNGEQGKGKERRAKAASGLPPLPTLEPRELERIIAEHEKWLESEGRQGKQADLSGVDLSGSAFRNVNLSRAILTGANLEGLSEFTDVNLGGADLRGAKLPGDFTGFEALSHVQEVSKNARSLFFLLVISCLYCWLTIGITTDTQLVTNSPTSSLPIIGTGIPIVGFYLAAPVFLLAIYCYFHLYVQRLWHFLSGLPAHFPDGRTLDDKVYPWLLNCLVRRHFALLRENKPALSSFQTGVSIIFAWGIVPLTIFVFWGTYLRRHDWYITAFHVVLLAATIVAGIQFYNLAKRTLSGQEARSNKGAKGRLTPLFMGIRHKANWLPLVLAFLISLWAIEGIPDRGLRLDPRTWIPGIFARIGFRTCADLEDKDISKRVEKWTGKDTTLPEELAALSITPLRRVDLRYARADRAFLVKADLRHADLRHAKLSGASLQGARLLNADLREANLYGAKLRRAHLGDANLRRADLQRARLSEANLQGADLAQANLKGADLLDAELNDANLRGAQLSRVVFSEATKLDGADLQGAHLDWAEGLTDLMLEKARNWPLASYEGPFLRIYGSQLGLPPDHNRNLKSRNFTKYILRWVNLRGADLRGMNLSGADLEGATLSTADLRNAVLKEANLRQADLTDADLRNADMQDVCLDETILEGADIDKADLRDTKGLTKEQFQSAKHYEKAIPPTFPAKGCDATSQ